MECYHVAHFWIVTTVLFIALRGTDVYCLEDEMEDFPLDANDTETEGVQTMVPSTVKHANNDEGFDFNQKLDVKGLASADTRIGMFNQIMNAAMKKPGVKHRLSQVLPIIRAMSPTQRLTLASLVLKQLTMSKSDQLIIDHLDQFDNATSELMLPISMDIASMFQGLKNDQHSGRSTISGRYYYNPLSPGYRVSGPQRPLLYNIRRFQANNGRKRDDVPPEMMPPPYAPSLNTSYVDFNISKNVNEYTKPSKNKQDEDLYESDSADLEEENEKKDCSSMTDTICIEMSSYPSKDIVNSIKQLEQKQVYKALLEDSLSDFTSESHVAQRRLGFEERENTLQLCASKVKYARPKKAKAMNGNWKFIVNTNHYSQTVRIETCQNIDNTCSFLNENVKSRCVQIYNYHRLLTWDEKSGLSLDLFKIPTCCSCQIERTIPFSGVKYSQDAGLQENIVEESTVAHSAPIKPRIKNKLNLPYNNLKREPFNSPRRPQQPILSLGQLEDDDFTFSTKYSQNNNSIRRTNLKTGTTNKGVYVQGKGILQENTAASHRVNYNYHPIIDFFKTIPPEANDRIDIADEWLPMTEGTRTIRTR